MKKIICLCLIICLFSAISFAEDLSSMTYDDLIEMNRKITAEIIKRPEWKEVTVPAGVYVIGKDIPAGEYSIECVDRSSIIEVNRIGKKSYVFYNLISQGEVIGKITLEEEHTISLSGTVIFRPPVLLGF